MSHKRQQIRDACKTTLHDETDAADRVYANRSQPLFGLSFPAIVIFATSETGEPTGIGDDPTTRTLELNIDCYCEATEDLDDELDDLTQAVEDLMADDDALEPALGWTLVSTAIDLGRHGEIPVGVARLTYAVTYLS